MVNQSKKGKLSTGEIINYAVIGLNETAFPKETNPMYVYVGTGNLLLTNGEADESVYHFWVMKKNYSIFDLKKGDKVFTHINVYGTLIPTWVVMAGFIGKSGAAIMLNLDGSDVELQFKDDDILYVEEGNTGRPIVKTAMAKRAINLGGFHMKAYAEEFNELPLKEGDYIEAGNGYDKENNLINVRNSHKVLSSVDLVYENWTPGSQYAVVRAAGLNKTAFLALNSIYVKKII